MTVAELLDIDIPATAQSATVSVPVPADVLWLLDERPAELGLDPGTSRRQMLQALLTKGVAAAASERRTAERERYYAVLREDGERAAVAAAVGDELTEDGIL